MKTIVILALPCAFLVSCANKTTERIIADSLGGATGAIVAHKASNGSSGPVPPEACSSAKASNTSAIRKPKRLMTLATTKAVAMPSVNNTG